MIDKSRVQYVMDHADKLIRFGKDDEPNKYGMTKKMLAISDLVENEKDLDDANFDVNGDDEIYYYTTLMFYEDAKKANGDKKPVICHYIND